MIRQIDHHRDAEQVQNLSYFYSSKINSGPYLLIGSEIAALSIFAISLKVPSLRMFRNIREFYKKHPVVTGAILGASVLNIFYQFSEDLFLPFYTNLLKPWIASGLKFLGINYPSFAGDNAVSQYTLLQRQQDFIRQSAEREKRMLEEIKKIREDLKDCHPIDLDMSEEGVK